MIFFSHLIMMYILIDLVEIFMVIMLGKIINLWWANIN
jgi:hypothetical protein